MKILSVVGARPQFVKLAPVDREVRSTGHEHVIVHTGQHYDANMSDAFFDILGTKAPDVNLAVGSGSHGVQTGAMLAALEGVIDAHSPDWVLVYGDTNSTIAAALAAVKLQVPVAHLEAGLRSFNRSMPEEHNRVMTDHAADLLLAPTEVAMGHLSSEGLGPRSLLVGDVMTDVCLYVDSVNRRTPPDLPFSMDGGFVLATIHRAENTDNARQLEGIIDGLSQLPYRVVLAAHPRLVARAAQFGIDLERGSLCLVEPLDYPRMLAAVRGARAVVTDSGGLQKEAFLLRTPCITIRTETEWTETVDLGWNVLSPDISTVSAHLARPVPEVTNEAPYGDGAAAERVVRALETHR